MKDPAPKDMSTSVRARLLNLSKASGQEFQALVLRYAVERFLVRLAASQHRERFVLKGAMLYVAWKLNDQRNTMDLDLLGSGSPDPAHLVEVVREICATPTDDDGLVFDGDAALANAIREEAVYDGVRIVVPVSLGVMAIRFQLDVGFGDTIFPAPQALDFPALLAPRGPRINAYPPETVIAEKFHAMVLLGMANSRMKDYFDIWTLGRTFPMRHAVLREAIEQTFARRQTPLPTSEPAGLSEAFTGNESKQRQWSGFVKRQFSGTQVPGLTEVVDGLRVLLLPVLVQTKEPPGGRNVWKPHRGWERESNSD